MFYDYFGITEDPFSITPDPKYLFLSERHRNGFAHLLYGVTQGGGFVQLTGEVGTGKTLLCRKLLDQLPRTVDVAFIFNPRLSPLELVATICDELRVLYPLGCSSIKEIVDFLNAYLLESHAQGRRTVVIIDEAQNLSFESLEQVRLLTNLETTSEKLLQIILVGQPELRALLNRPELRQLAQRVTARYHLTPLSRGETRAYILHRLSVAGLERPVFTEGTIRRVFKLSGGIPRLINILCNRGMLAAFSKQKEQVTRSMLSLIATELRGDEYQARSVRGAWGWVLAGCCAALFVVAMLPVDDLFRLLTGSRDEKNEAVQSGLHDREGSAIESVAIIQSEQSGQAAGDKQADTQSIQGITQETESAVLQGSATAAGTDSGREMESAPHESPSLASAPLVDAPLQRLSGLMANENSAFSTLFSYWQEVYPEGDGEQTSCDKAEQVGLSCIFGRGSWKTLEYYNRPAVLELLTEQDQRYHVVVSKLSAQSVTLDLNGRRLLFDRSEIARLWTGSYVVLWRPPKLNIETLQMGHSGSDVGWLISMLDRIEGQQSDYDPLKARFDQRLHMRVIRFQRDHGLLADGIVGKQTLIQLNASVADLTKPALLEADG
jgi:general secretion pathway protein A